MRAAGRRDIPVEDAVSAWQPHGFHQDVAAFILSILLQPGFQSFLVWGAVVCWISTCLDPCSGGCLESQEATESL